MDCQGEDFKSGSARSLTVYGRVPSQATPSTGTYTVAIGLTVTY